MNENKEASVNTKQNGNKATKIAIIATAVLIVCIAAYFGITKVIIPNRNYNAAVALMNEGKIVEAYESQVAMNGYKDSAEKAESLYDMYKLLTSNVGDYLSFGAYEQDNDTSNGKETIEWQVLAKGNNKILVISQYALDAKPYNTEYEDITWETCTLRIWLNETFLNEAFSEAEQSIIQTSEVPAGRNPKYSIALGNDTEDRIFLLSIDEANKYFASDEARMCVPTAYAKANGARTNDDYKVDGAATCWWWLRSPGDYLNYAASVDGVGGVRSNGNHVSSGLGCVRPTLWIELNALS